MRNLNKHILSKKFYNLKPVKKTLSFNNVLEKYNNIVSTVKDNNFKNKTYDFPKIKLLEFVNIKKQYALFPKIEKIENTYDSTKNRIMLTNFITPNYITQPNMNLSIKRLYRAGNPNNKKQDNKNNENDYDREKRVKKIFLCATLVTVVLSFIIADKMCGDRYREGGYCVMSGAFVICMGIAFVIFLLS